jgi:replicative DNA helicase
MGEPLSPLCRVPPHAEDAEQAVLGAVLRDPACLPFVRAIIGPDDVYVEAHRAIFEAMLELQSAGTGIDTVTLADRLTARGQFARVGGTAYLDQCWERIPLGGSYVEDQARIIRRDAGRRHAIFLGAQVQAAAFAPDADLAALSGMLSRGSAEILPAQPARRPAEILRSQIASEPGRQLRFHLAGVDQLGGPADLGGMLGYLSPGQKVIVGGRTSEGKTALLRMFWLACGVAGTPAAFLSFEDSDDEIVGGAAGSVSWLTTRPILAHRWSESAREEAERIAKWLDRLPLSCAYLSTPTIEEMVNAVRWQVAHEHARVVILDFLQKIRGGDGREGRVSYLGRALAEMSRAVRDEAVLVVGSQLRRPPAGAKGYTPRKDDLRDSGEIEEDAKAVVLLRRLGDDVLERGVPSRRGICLDVAKNKLGPTGEINATLWLRNTSLWPGVRRPAFDLAKGPQEPAPGPEDDPGDAPEWVQQEMRTGEQPVHEAFVEDDPWGNR